LASLDDVAITRAPTASASCAAKSETPPVPWTSTLAPGTSGAGPSKSACHAVTAAHGSVAACSNESARGIATTPRAGSTAYSASTPSRGPIPKPTASCSGRYGPDSQVG